MSSHWKGSVHVSAPAEEVYAYLADFARHPEWDETAIRIEQSEPGEADGVGARWRAYERLDALKSDRNRKPLLRDNAAGVTVREVRELVPHQRVAWHTFPLPRVGVTADCAFELVAGAEGTTVTLTVNINVPAVMESVTKFVFRGLDAKQQALWQQSLENVKQHVEHGAAVPAGV